MEAATDAAPLHRAEDMVKMCGRLGLRNSPKNEDASILTMIILFQIAKFSQLTDCFFYQSVY